MNRDQLRENAHLFLGISRSEFLRRLQTGVIDFEILKAQIELRTLETELESACEQSLAAQSAEQVDKFEILKDSAL